MKSPLPIPLILSLLFASPLPRLAPAETEGEETSSEHRSAEEWLRLPQPNLTKSERKLLKRPDENRPAKQYSRYVLGRPLTLGWSYEARGTHREEVPFKDRRVDDVQRLSQVLTIDGFYRLSESASLFLRGKSFQRSTWVRFDGHNRDLDNDSARARGFARGEMWLFLRDIANSPFSLQVGRQRFSDDREWWWDDDLDAIRLHFDRSKLHFELGAAQLLTRVDTEESHLDPEEEDVLRFLARGAWEWRKGHRVELFALRQLDGSDTQARSAFMKDSREDESDADLWWVGAALKGKKRLASLGTLSYWADGAIVDGRETFLDYGSIRTETDETRVVVDLRGNEILVPLRRNGVDLRERHGVHGWGMDLGLSWQTPLPGHPTLTLGYALGSGDSRGKDESKQDRQEAQDRSFRQTGLQDNNGRFSGVDRFKYYGELLDPELSNLRIGTAALGFRIWEKSSVEILYHFYRQDHPAKFLRDAGIRRQPAGRKRGIGREIDVVIGIEEWEHVEIELIGAAFRAGPAYGEHCDDDLPLSDPFGESCDKLFTRITGVNGESGIIRNPDLNDIVSSGEGEWSYLVQIKFKLNF